MKKLSKKLPTAIKQAVEDLKKVRRDSKYKINMSYWYQPNGYQPDRYGDEDGDKSVCFVCFAGCVMANRFELDKEKAYIGTEELFKDRHGIIDALDVVRCGVVDSAIEYALGIDLNERQREYLEGCPQIRGWHGTEPPKRFDLWCEDVLKVAEWLDKRWGTIRKWKNTK